jgi:hypothetical protein
LHHRFTLTGSGCPGPAVCFLWHCPAGHPGWALPTTLPYGARTFLGGSGLVTRPTRPPGRLIRATSVASGRLAVVRLDPRTAGADRARGPGGLDYRSLGHAKAVSSYPSGQALTMVSEAGGTRRRDHPAGAMPMAEPTPARIVTVWVDTTTVCPA